jgi:hypothetical protein
MVPRKFRTKEARRKARSRALLFLVLWITLTLFALWLIFFVLRQEFIRVDSVTISGVRELDASELESVVKGAMEGYYMWSVPKDSTLFVRVRGIEEVVREWFPRIKSVSVSRAGLRGLQVTIEERTAKALWCGDVVPPHVERTGEVVTAQGVCYVVDEEGYVFARASVPYDPAQNRYYGSLEKSEPTGQYLFSSEEFHAWQYFHAYMLEHEYPLRAFLVTDERDVEAYLALPARVLFPRKSDSAVVAERLVATLVSDAFDATKEVDYVDMRFQNRVFVKYVEPVSLDESEADTLTPSVGVQDEVVEEQAVSEVASTTEGEVSEGEVVPEEE